MSNKNSAIFDIWIKTPLPKIKGNREMFQLYKTNLWIFKNSFGDFGFLITGTICKLSQKYKNIIPSWKRKLKNSKGQELKNCLLIESNNTIDSELFCSTISFLFDDKDKNRIYNAEEIEAALLKIEKITLKELDELNAVVGVWGELYLINEFIKKIKNSKDKLELIESWEGLENRSKIDFHFSSKETKIEVKTTLGALRIHHFNGLEQVSKDHCRQGLLASLCIYLYDNGVSCLDIVDSIKKNIPKSIVTIFESKLKLRGKECLNNKYHFSISTSKEFEFFEFEEIPKPITEDGIGSIEWTAVLDNKKYLSKTKKEKLFNIFN
jgi:hypothetical protein